VLFNLLGNAVKFTFSGSITVHLSYRNRKVITEVKDTGVGIKNDEIQKLFQFFGRLQHSKKINKGGMGFGLTISKMIV
jgi:signal transduction histidine kinase